MYRLSSCFLLFALSMFAGCIDATHTTISNPADGKSSKVLLSVISDAQENPQKVDMALKLAGFALEEERSVALFFNVKGVRVPTQEFSDEFAFQNEPPLKTQLSELIERGAEVHVCPICMKALGVEEADLMEGAIVTTRPKLFANIDARTAVFTY